MLSLLTQVNGMAHDNIPLAEEKHPSMFVLHRRHVISGVRLLVAFTARQYGVRIVSHVRGSSARERKRERERERERDGARNGPFLPAESAIPPAVSSQATTNPQLLTRHLPATLTAPANPAAPPPQSPRSRPQVPSLQQQVGSSRGR